MEIPKWIDVKKEKPSEDCLCYVFNNRFGGTGFIAMYYHTYDVFQLYNPSLHEHPILDVTHWIQLPDTSEAGKR